MTKEVKRTILDDAYDVYWATRLWRPSSDDLISAVRSFALKMTRDEDIAQDVSVIVFQNLERFRRADPTAFTRWVRTIIRRVRLDSFSRSSVHTKLFDEEALPLHDDAEYVDLSQLPDDIKHVANELLAGYSLTEIAVSQNKTPAALRNKLARFRKSPLRNAA